MMGVLLNNKTKERHSDFVQYLVRIDNVALTVNFTNQSTITKVRLPRFSSNSSVISLTY